MRTLFINMIFFGAIAGILISMGFNYTTWQYWTVLMLASLMQINNGVRE